MTRNYMQDITPPSDEHGPLRAHRDEMPERSIRSIRPSAARARLAPRPHLDEAESPIAPPELPVRPHRRRSHAGIMVAAAALVVVLGGASLLFLFPSTSVTVIPRSQVVTFDASMPFAAYPEEDALPGSIFYTVFRREFEDSAVVQANGTDYVESQAKGTITVYNNHSEEPVALIKNTRFQTPDGLIFRIPVSIDVPGKSGGTPGSIDVEVFADQTGPEYNVGPFKKLTIPGLKSLPEMYENVYAQSGRAFQGGFSGERPAVTESVLEAAQAEVRGRLQEKANELARSAPEGMVAFPGLATISFETLAPTEEGSGSVRIHERATIVMPIFPAGQLAQMIAESVSANAEGQSVEIQLLGINAAPADQLSVADLGREMFTFTLSGRGQLVWHVDEAALAEALAGREEAAFQTVIESFPSIEEARARLMPFWRSTFPAEDKIRVTVEQIPEL